VSDSSISVVLNAPASAADLLDSWVSADWSAGVRIADLQPFDQLTVTTRNTVYTIVVVCPRSGEIQVRGGTLFPSFATARLCGSSLGRGLLKCGVLHPGFCMELCHSELKTIVTTRVRTLTVNAAAAPPSASSVM
jgi:hypothetical protein